LGKKVFLKVPKGEASRPANANLERPGLAPSRGKEDCFAQRESSAQRRAGKREGLLAKDNGKEKLLKKVGGGHAARRLVKERGGGRKTSTSFPVITWGASCCLLLMLVEREKKTTEEEKDRNSKRRGDVSTRAHRKEKRGGKVPRACLLAPRGEGKRSSDAW